MGGSSKNREKIVAGIREIVGFGKYEIYSAQVKTVDEGATTMDVLINEDLLIYDVRLRSVIDTDDGLYVIPAVDSYVVIGKIDGGVDFILIQASKIDKILFKIGTTTGEFTSTGIKYNGGNKGGLINIVDQTTKLNQLVTEVQTQLGLIATGLAGVGGSYAPGVLSSFVKTDFEDTKIKH